MVYRFDADGNGDVIAEDHVPGVPGFLGLRYPASDIPQQARQLYMVQKVRVIVDVAAAPVSLLAAPGSAPADLDLSASWLRAVSPVHLRYLSNMGVGASAAVSLIIEGRLWGMLVCHHNARHEISAYQRRQLDLVGQVMSVMLSSLMRTEMSASKVQRKRALAGIAAVLANADPTIADAFAVSGRNLVNLIAADGVVVKLGERMIEFGCTPTALALRTLMAAIAAAPASDVTVSENLADSLQLAPASLDGFAGALYLRLPDCDGGAIMWLRRELNLTVTWAGDPHKRAADPDSGRLEPRESFAAWREIVRGRSVSWTDADVACARDLRHIVDAAWVQRSANGQRHAPRADSPTGLVSREAIEDHLNAVAESSPQPPIALAILNIDRFHKVNEAHGRAAGDSLLVQIGQRLRAAVKAGDMVARMGPVEFGVLSATGLGIELGARLTAVFSQAFEIDGKVVPLQASVGVADNAPVVDHVRGLLHSAHMALRQAQLAGGDRVTIFAAASSDGASRQMQIEQSLEAALKFDREQFQLALQPIVDAGSGAVVSWEVLLRWDHPLLGNIPPSEFIPIAEGGGLIEAVGDLVLEAALRLLVELPPSVELIGRDVSLSVDVSPLQLSREGFADEIGGMLDARGIDHSRLCLEITEAALANPQAVAALTGVRASGIRVAIDAFGIGQSSLATLQRLPADIVKLDRSFLPEQDSTSTGGRSFLTAVVALAHAAGLRVTVEGVENQVQLNAVVIAGADTIQGYLLGEPMTTEAAVALASKCTEERTWQPQFAEATLIAASASLAAESPGILERLRSSTRAAHLSIETVPRFGRLLSPDITTPDYVQTLRLLHAFHASIEPDLARCLRGSSRAEALLDGTGLAALATDIAWFGAIPIVPQRLQEPATTVATALGALYVIEGSKLGGRVIGRHVAKTLAVGPGSGGSYYCGLTAEDARRRWRLLQEVLRREIDQPGATWQPVTAAALATFESLETWMRSDSARLALIA
jgi:diguanylate cyclase (GGDEF)-like protein